MPPGGSSRIIASRGHSFYLTTFAERCAARRQNPLGAPRWTDVPPATPAIRLPGRASNSLCDSAVTGLVWLPNWLSARYLRSGELVPVLSQIRLLPVKSTPSGLTAVIYRPKRGRRSTSCWRRCQASCQGTKGGVCARENPSSRAAGCTVCGILVSACHKGSGTRHTAF